MFSFKSDKQKLAINLEKLISLLNCHGVTQWPDRLKESLELIRKDDGYGVEKILSEFGGMGSLNDLYICSSNGHLVRSLREEKSANLKLDGYRRKIYKLAKSLE